MSNNEFNWSVIGHKNIVDFLQHSIEKKNFSHAYIFYGAEHLGKKTVAKYLAKSILCHDYHQADSIPCGKCIHCRQFNNNIHPDIVVIKRLADKKTGKLKKNISIEQIRAMRDKLTLSSFLKSYKIAIIEAADKMSLGAVDSLLKTLEEPSGKTILILLTSRLEALPLTVVSRCQKIKFLPLSFDEVYDYLVKIKKVKRNSALNLASIIQGKPGLIEYFSEEKNLKNYYQSLENNLNLINRPDYQRIEFINSIVPKTLEPEQQKEVSLDFFQQWETIIRCWLLTKNSSLNTVSYLTDKLVGTGHCPVPTKYQNNKLIKLLDKIKQSRVYLSGNVSPKLVLENFVLDF